MKFEIQKVEDMMMKRDVLIADDAPVAIGPYSLGIRSGDMVFVSGTLGVDPGTGEMVSGGIAAETRQVLTNLAKILKAGGSSLRHVVKTTVFMQNMGEFAEMNAVYAEFFTNDPPARSTVQVAALPKGAAVEIEAIAVVGGYLGD
jgi:2-iminobutanoate/2-iminopropanoate deaminase